MRNIKGPPWHTVERAIREEKRWLLRVFDFNQLREKKYAESAPAFLSSDEMFRQLSISIVSGKIHARELATQKINGLWTNDTQLELSDIQERHGGEWHRAMMGLVKKHFIENSFEVITEPELNYGRADLGVYKQGYPNLYVEIGTTSLFKVWFNLHTMPKSIFLFVPSVYYALEFQTK